MKSYLKQTLLFLLFLILAGVLFVLWAKVPDPNEDNVIYLTGEVSGVSSPCCNDVVIILSEDEHIYYINRGTELAIDPSEWREKLRGKKVKLGYIKTRWNPFNAQGTHRPLAEVFFNGKPLFAMTRD